MDDSRLDKGVISQKPFNVKISLGILDSDNVKTISRESNIFFSLSWVERVLLLLLKPDILYAEKHEKI